MDDQQRATDSSSSQQHVIVLSGNSDGAVLHAVYTAAERLLGVRFLLSGDVIPKLPAGHRLPRARHSLSPRFATSGLQPFHDFAVGPDWWSLDDFKMVMGQQRRMQMNFIGFHSYPWAPANATASGRAVSQHHGHGRQQSTLTGPSAGGESRAAGMGRLCLRSEWGRDG